MVETMSGNWGKRSLGLPAPFGMAGVWLRGTGFHIFVEGSCQGRFNNGR